MRVLEALQEWSEISMLKKKELQRPLRERHNRL
jgi:hypothetical protein